MEETINDRIKKLRKSLKMTQGEFSAPFDMTQGAFSDVERGKNGVSFALLENIVRNHNASADWLILGEGKMFRDSKSKEQQDRLSLLEERLASLERRLS